MGVQARGLYISPGSELYVGPGTVLVIDSLVVKPLAGYNLAGENFIIRATTLLHPSSNPHINRVFRWNNLLSSLSGEITFYYRDDELNGLQEDQLAGGSYMVRIRLSDDTYINRTVIKQ